jgi:hypothetical protein
VPKEGPPVWLAREPAAASELEGLLGYWDFDEGQGEKAADNSGNGINGKVQASWIRGVRGKALWFKDRGDSFNYGASWKFNYAAGAPFTYAGWVQTRAQEGIIVSQRNSEDGGANIEIAVKDGKISFMACQDKGERGEPVRVTGGVVNDGDWHHFACARTKNGILRLYLDGRAAGDATGDKAKGAITTDWRTLGVEMYWVKVRQGGHPYLSGCVDEFCIFDHELSVKDVRKLAGR